MEQINNHDMNHLIIIGAGGMGRSIYDMAQGCVGYGVDFDIKGFIDDNIHALDMYPNYPPLLSSISDYLPKDKDVFVCSIGSMQTKRMVCELLKEKSAKFLTLIHRTAVVGSNSIIGEGSVLAEYSLIGSDAVIGENSLIQCYAVIGHDCHIGDYVRIDTHCTCVGGITICDGATIHTSSVINHNVMVGKDATVGALSFVIRKVEAGTTVCGNPARKLVF